MAATEADLCTESARVYLNRQPADIPPHPGNEWTRFVCLSDTHSATIPTPAGDVLLHSGDIGHGRAKDIKEMFEWLKTLPHEKKVIIAGNHDLCLDVNWRSMVEVATGMFKKKDSGVVREFVRSLENRQAGIHYLEHERLELEIANGRVWKIYGSPASPQYSYGAFQYEDEEEATGIYSKIPTDTEILLTHTPSYRTLDKTRHEVYAGCPVLAAKLQELTECKLHVCGHIHEAYGAEVGPGNRISVNAAVVKERQPVVIDLKNGGS